MKFSVPWPTSTPHRTGNSETRGLLGGKLTDQALLGFGVGGTAHPAEDHARHLVQRAALLKLHQHPIDPVRFFAGVFQQQDLAREIRSVRRAEHRHHDRQTAANQLALRGTWMNHFGAVQRQKLSSSPASRRRRWDIERGVIPPARSLATIGP